MADPIGPVITPANFQATSQQGLVSMTWSPVFGINFYVITREGPDGLVTFSVPGTSYSDTTAIIGTVYSYTIQAFDGTNYSPPAPTQYGQALNPGQTTVSNIILEAQQRCNKENSPFYTQQELISMVAQSYKELYDKVVTAFGDDYYVMTPYTYTTGQNQQMYPLPADFYKLLLCEVALNPQDPNSYVTLKQFNLIQKNLFNYPNQYTMYGITNLRYRLNGNNLMIVPQTQGGQTIRIWYVPRPNQLISLYDTLDGVAGWEEYVVADVCIKMLAKEESDTSVFGAQKAMMSQRLDEMSKNRNIGEPQTVSDSKYRNFSWGDPGDGWNSGM